MVKVPVCSVIVPMHSLIKLGLNVSHEVYAATADNRMTSALATQCIT